MSAGRPSVYSENIIDGAKAYLESCIDETEQVISGESEKFTKYENRLKVKLPTIEGLAIYLKIHRDTVYQWAKEHPEFSDIISELRSKQAESLINNGLSGAYNPTIAKVLLSKHGYKESVENEQKGGITIRFEEPGNYVYPSQDQGDNGIPESL